MIPGFEPFLRAIIESPDDDLIRLIAADWLIEHGQQERAEFIQVQCRLDSHRRWFEWANARPGRTVRGRPPKGDPWNTPPPGVKQLTLGQVSELLARERELLETDGPPIHGTRSRLVGGQWIHESYRWMPLGAIEAQWCEFRRGFVEEVTCTAANWIANANGLLAATPLREVTLTTWPALFTTVSNYAQNLAGHTQQLSGSTSCHYHDTILNLLTVKWPSVRFTLPERGSDDQESL